MVGGQELNSYIYIMERKRYENNHGEAISILTNFKYDTVCSSNMLTSTPRRDFPIIRVFTIFFAWRCFSFLFITDSHNETYIISLRAKDLNTIKKGKHSFLPERINFFLS